MTEVDHLTVLVTGGAGFIGSHTCVELLNAGTEVVVLDNLSNSSPRSLDAVQRITNRPLSFVEGDIRDPAKLDEVFSRYRIDAVLHFAGLKAVAESVRTPVRYFDNNVTGTLSLLDAMNANNVKTMVFSSSATVYGDPDSVPIREDCPTSPTNPYGRSKLMVEQVLDDLAASDPEWRISVLRYFNPVGAHQSGELGEDPTGEPDNLMPYITQVAVGARPHLRVFGSDYPTHDGTGVRDYIHVVDLARGHLAALRYLESHAGLAIHNLGTGRGYSVLEVVRAFEVASGVPVEFRMVERRPGDVAECYADPSRAASDLHWRAEFGLEEMSTDAWRWQSKYPRGFERS